MLSYRSVTYYSQKHTLFHEASVSKEKYQLCPKYYLRALHPLKERNGICSKSPRYSLPTHNLNFHCPLSDLPNPPEILRDSYGVMNMFESFYTPELPEVLTIKRPTDRSSHTQDKCLADVDGPISSGPVRELPGGCYFLKWVQPTPNPRYSYFGTMRVEKDNEDITASADLYSHLNWRLEFNPTPVTKFFPEPIPSADIPIFRREDYAFYLRIEEIRWSSSTPGALTVYFERNSYDPISRKWEYDGFFRASMAFDAKPPPGYPPGSTCLHGNIYNDGRNPDRWEGVLTMVHVSSYLRKATVEIDRSPQSESPLDNGDGVTWETIFDDLGWDLTVEESDADLREPSGESWSMSELHSAMIERRDSADLDSEWRYHLLCVRELDFTSRGVMYDAYDWDVNNNPREGAAISSHWTIPNQTELWGDVAGERFGAAQGPYFRTAVHEIGHAMGLYHNTNDNGIMNATNAIAASPGIFPRNILWSFNREDSRRLKHLPDPWVRPGMMRFGDSYSSVPISTIDNILTAKTLSLDVKPLLSVVPFGAPVRVKITLRNIADGLIMAPSSLSFKHGHVSGFVKSPSRHKVFNSVTTCVDQKELQPLKPGKDISNDLTLIAGPREALFSEIGVHRIVVRVHWEESDVNYAVEGRTHVMIQSATTDKQAEAALKLVTTPEILLTVAIGGDHLKEGLEALKIAMEDEVLARHYAAVDAKRLARPFFKRGADHEAAIEVLRKGSIMSSTEKKRITSLLGGAAKEVDFLSNGHKEANGENPE